MNRIVFSLPAIFFACLIGCQTGVAPTEMLVSQTPPAVQSAWLTDHNGTTVQKVTSVPVDGQPTYTFEYKNAAGDTKSTTYNVGGNVINEK